MAMIGIPSLRKPGFGREILAPDRDETSSRPRAVCRARARRPPAYLAPWAGQDRPADAKLVSDRKAERQAETVAELVEEYLERWARPNKRSAAEDERVLRKDVIPHWDRRKAKDIVRRDVIALLDRIVERGAPIAANRTFGIVRRMFNWAISRGLLSFNPRQGVREPGQEASRDRVLNEDEIARFWRGLDEARMSEVIRQVLRLMLTTAQRKGEIVTAEWSEIPCARPH